MAKTVTIRIDDEVYESFTRHADEERRSLGKFIEHAVIEYTKQEAFVSDDEMDAIANDSGLVRRMKQGTQEAKKGRGRFVA